MVSLTCSDRSRASWESFRSGRRRAPLVGRIGETDIVDRGYEIAGADQGVAPHRHRRAAGMAGVAVEGEPERLGLVAADHDADVAALAVEHRRLLDMQLEIGVEHALPQRRGAGIADLVERLGDRVPFRQWSPAHCPG